MIWLQEVRSFIDYYLRKFFSFLIRWYITMYPFMTVYFWLHSHNPEVHKVVCLHAERRAAPRGLTYVGNSLLTVQYTIKNTTEMQNVRRIYTLTQITHETIDNRKWTIATGSDWNEAVQVRTVTTQNGDSQKGDRRKQWQVKTVTKWYKIGS